MKDPQGHTPTQPQTDESLRLNPRPIVETVPEPEASGIRPPVTGALHLDLGAERTPAGCTSTVTHAADVIQETAQSAPETTPEAAAPTGLVLEGTSHTTIQGPGWTLRDDECPLEGAVSVDATTGEVVWRPTCKNARCRRCSRQVSAKTFALARRMADDKSTAGEFIRFITLTQAPEGWEPTRKAMQDWLQHLRRKGYEMHVLWVVETGSETGMKHVHVVQWGDFIPISVLEASWPHGSTQIAAAKGAASDYLAKGVLKYVAKGIDGDGDSIEAHMNLNGGRAAHWSRSFYDGESRKAYGQRHPVPGIYFVKTVRAGA